MAVQLTTWRHIKSVWSISQFLQGTHQLDTFVKRKVVISLRLIQRESSTYLGITMVCWNCLHVTLYMLNNKVYYNCLFTMKKKTKNSHIIGYDWLYITTASLFSVHVYWFWLFCLIFWNESDMFVFCVSYIVQNCQQIKSIYF